MNALIMLNATISMKYRAGRGHMVWLALTLNHNRMVMIRQTTAARTARNRSSGDVIVVCVASFINHSLSLHYQNPTNNLLRFYTISRPTACVRVAPCKGYAPHAATRQSAGYWR